MMRRISSARTVLAAFVLLLFVSSAGAQVSRSGMGIFYGFSRITGNSFTTNTGDLMEFTGEKLSLPHSLYGFSYETRQLFKYGLYTNYRIVLASNHLGLEDYTGTGYSFQSLSFFDVAIAPELGFDLLKNIGYKKLSAKKRLSPFIDNALNVFGGIEFYTPSFSIKVNQSGGDAAVQTANDQVRDVLFTRKLHFNAYLGAGLRVKNAELDLQYYFYSSRLYGLTITDPLLYRPMLTFMLKYSI